MSCAYCRTSAPATYYGIARRRLIRHWLCDECVAELRGQGVDVTPLPCAICRKSTREHTGHDYTPVGFGK